MVIEMKIERLWHERARSGINRVTGLGGVEKVNGGLHSRAIFKDEEKQNGH